MEPDRGSGILKVFIEMSSQEQFKPLLAKAFLGLTLRLHRLRPQDVLLSQS